MEFQTIASSSKGNAYYLGDDEAGLLIDCGVSMRRIEKALGDRKERIKGIFLTHEHRDHIGGLGPFLRRYNIPCFGTAKTLAAVQEKVQGIEHASFHPVDAAFSWQGFHIQTASVSHDAADPVCYRFSKNDKAFAMATDMGYVSAQVANILYDATFLLIESNHDETLLRTGPYPYYLKERIASEVGHISNKACASALKEVITESTSHVLLAHLSEENNRPIRAFTDAKDVLQTLPLTGKVFLGVAVPERVGPLVEF